MTPATLTLTAVNRHIETTQEDGRRAHLGASIIGRKCPREIWYVFRWALRINHDGRLLRLFNRGHKEEARFVEYLRAIGIEVFDTDDRLPMKDGKPQQFKVGAHSGHFGGSLDGVAKSIPDLPGVVGVLLEFKTHSLSSFLKLADSGVMGAKFEHYVQMQIYMHLMGLTHALYMAVNKNNDEWHLELVANDGITAQQALDRAGDIIYSNVAPNRIATSPSSYACKYCDFKELCFNGAGNVDRNCRTCMYSRPGADSLWICGLRNVTLDVDAQKAACGSYLKNSHI